MPYFSHVQHHHVHAVMCEVHNGHHYGAVYHMARAYGHDHKRALDLRDRAIQAEKDDVETAAYYHFEMGARGSIAYNLHLEEEYDTRGERFDEGYDESTNPSNGWRCPT